MGNKSIKYRVICTIIYVFIFLLYPDYTFAQNPGNALDFDGSNDYVSIPDATALDITDQITIEAWFKPSSSSWAYKKLITIDYTKVSVTLTDFPVLVSVTDVDLKDSDNGGPIQPDGDDILFIKTDGTKLSHEIEKYDGSTGQLVAWVKIPSLSSSTDTEFSLCYGNSSCSSQQDATNVWDSNFKGVCHLDESGNGTADEFADGTSNANHGTGQGAGAPTQATGKIGNGQNFSEDYIILDAVANDIDVTKGTYSLWVELDPMSALGLILSTYPAGDQHIEFKWLNGPEHVTGQYRNGSDQVFVDDPVYDDTADVWHYATMTWNNPVADELKSL